MADVPEEKKKNMPTTKEKKKVQWDEEELKLSKQQQQHATEKLQYRPKQLPTTISAAPKSETHEKKEKKVQQVVHEKPAHNNERQPRQQKLHGQRTQSAASNRNMQSYG